MSDFRVPLFLRGEVVEEDWKAFGARGAGGFEDIFGGGGGFGGQRSPRQGKNLQVRVALTLEEINEGATKKIKLKRQDRCVTCKGSGAKPGSDPVTCSSCGGAGQVRRVQRSLLSQFVSVAPCVACSGTGQTISYPCDKCRGEGRAGDAQRYYRRVVSLSRDEPGAEALYHLGSLMLREGEARTAVEELSRMPVLYAGFPNWLARGYLLQARAFRSLGQTGDASQLYDRIIQDFSGTPYAEEAAREKASL